MDLRHRCTGCGGSCAGVVVRPVDDEEGARLGASAASLGVDHPFSGGALRRNFGRCVFLDDAHRCRLHAAFGPAAKPSVCRQYPWVAVDTEQGRRVGVDPGCYTALVSPGGDGPPEALLAIPDHRKGAWLDAEREALASVGAGLGPQRRNLDRWRQAVSVVLPQVRERPELGSHLRSALAPLEPTEPPSELANRGLPSIEAMLTLRLAPALDPLAVWWLLAGAAIDASARTGDPAVFAWRLAGWCRLARTPIAHAVMTNAVYGPEAA